ncbi:heterokaryon incompatibility protein-domain-containing protein [Lasiosphaeria ovina]|uniref:Heterokaryon incompatibility protein-domain-containing protein n=1 Tax=Lasiosphaeria ovina TaxID=92902 RepID=A0AAE0K778_9PEZI|nr:heterokaryon incompatibility protein-domain-containing protein [Lasiosphaeria ovina]
MSNLAAFSDITSADGRNATASQSIYAPISEDHIRLVRLHSAAAGGMVSCSLIPTRRGDAPAYEALSYVWGSQENLQPIRLNGRVFYVTENLHSALARLRRPTEDRLLWIDALAINQLDLSERSAQVQAMPFTYSRAERTLAWLGEGDENVSTAVKNLAEIDENATFTLLDREVYRRYVDVFGWLAFLPYWNRVWVAQETHYSNSVVFLYGVYSFSFGTLQNLISCVRRSSYADHNLSYATVDALIYLGGILLRSIPLWDFQPGSAKDENFLDLPRWLKACCQRECSDPRDIIFGFHNCLEPAIRPHITVSYTRTIAQVFLELTEAFFRTTGNLEILGYIDDLSFATDHDLRGSPIPSWVPNYADGGGVGGNAFRAIKDHNETKIGPESVIIPAFFRLADEGKLLHVVGIKIATCERVSQSFTIDQNFDSDTRAAEILSHFVRCREQLEVSESGDDIKVYARALVGPLGQRSDILNVFLESKEPIRLADKRVRDLQEMHHNEIEYWRMAHDQRPLFSFMSSQTITGTSGAPSTGPWRRFGIGAKGMREGDRIYIICGCSTHIVVRPQGAHNIIVGTCFFPQKQHEMTGMDLQRDLQSKNPQHRRGNEVKLEELGLDVISFC